MTQPSGTEAAVGPKPWQRALAGVLALGFAALAVLAVADIGSGRPAAVKHITGALALVFLLAGPCALVAVPTVAVRVYAYAFWLLPASVIWFGAEHFADWRAFILTGGARGVRATTQTSVEVVGAIIVGLGIVGLGVWAGFTAYAVRRRRNPSLLTVHERMQRRAAERNAGRSAPRITRRG